MIDIALFPASGLQCLKDLHKQGFEAYFVGGCIRDVIMGVTPHDFDICTNARPEEVMAIMEDCGRKYIETGLKHGTLTAVYDCDFYEITTYRSDGEYKNHRCPESVQFEASINADLSRRDFTINAMAYDPFSEDFVDLFGGKSDIENKVIRAVGEPHRRFDEDGLRILRALRFAIRYEFAIDVETAAAMIELKRLLRCISKERVTAELEKMLTCGKPVAPLFTQFAEVIGEIIPELKPCFGFDQNNKYHKHNVYEHSLAVVDFCKSNKFEIKLAALLHDIGKPESYVVDEEGWGHFYGHPEISHQMAKKLLARRLRLSAEQEKLTLALVLHHDMSVADTPKSVRRALRNHGEAFLRDWFILKQADMDDHIYPKVHSKYPSSIAPVEELMDELLATEACFSLKDLAVNGKDVMEHFNMTPSPKVGEILKKMLDAVVDEVVENEKEKLLEFATMHELV